MGNLSLRGLGQSDLDPQSGPETIDELMQGIEDGRVRAQKAGVDALFAMKAEMSREEWDALFNE